ncbi:outer membrane protein transport protein [Psychromarinibacter sp. C21-152]|uniref:Outer membrane protein transport protein n=1 Tax=Psychromarinibacter sediminicola TaxID=3033385 RepID=A0AAE3TC91_9RHOB|nr:outer membrane protein transport protein [Psychromarinibacter sediminicola]MDF0603714.1 outer membrane protein transport protein [Psychromarinibacter sediminicola]
MRGAAICGLISVLAVKAAAGGLDTTGQPITFMFSEGTVAELGYARVMPTTSGNDSPHFGGSPTGNIASEISLPSGSFKVDATDKLSFGFILEKPFGADVTYGPSSVAFAGTTASADTSSMTTMLRYRFTDRFSVHGGLRWQQAEAGFGLNGALYGPFSGYSASMARDSGLGYVIGAAYEIPEYFLRISLTYNSEIEHSFVTTEMSGPVTLVSTVDATTPQSLNLEFVSGIAPETFVFGGARWVEWSKLQFAPPILSAATSDPLVDFNDTVTYRLGIGRQLSDRWTATAALIYEPSTSPRTTVLTPVDGFYGAALGLVYSKDDFQIQTNIVATRLGDATPFVSDLGTTVSSFSGNSSVGFGMKFVKRF